MSESIKDTVSRLTAEKDRLRAELAAATDDYSLTARLSDALTREAKLRAELAAVVERAQKREHSLSSSVATLGNENARLRAELEQIASVWEYMWRAKHKEARAEWIVSDMLAWVKENEAERDTLRAALVQAGEALEKSRVFTNGEFLRRAAGDDESYDEDEQAIPLLSVLDDTLTEIRKLTGENDDD